MLMVMMILMSMLMMMLQKHLDESRHRRSPVAAEPIVLPLVSSVRVQSGEHFIFLSECVFFESLGCYISQHLGPDVSSS